MKWNERNDNSGISEKERRLNHDNWPLLSKFLKSDRWCFSKHHVLMTQGTIHVTVLKKYWQHHNGTASGNIASSSYSSETMLTIVYILSVVPI